MRVTVGITGTRHGLTDAQTSVLRQFLELFRRKGYTDFVHGDCKGVDVEAAAIAASLGFNIHTRPSQLRTRGVFTGPHTLYTPRGALERNKDIVDQADVMLAFPETATEQRRSGTWHAIRYAKAQQKPLRIVCPDGSIVR